MIRKLLFFVCVLMSLTASSMQNKGSESRKEIELREVKDTVTHDVVHSKRKVPSMKPNIPVVEYIPEESKLVFESSVYQLISFYITDCTQTEIIHSEYLELSPDCESGVLDIGLRCKHIYKWNIICRRFEIKILVQGKRTLFDFNRLHNCLLEMNLCCKV